MKTIWTLAIKDLKVLSRDKGAVFFIVAFPILMGVFFGIVMGGPSSGGGSSAMKIAMVDEDQSEISKSFVNQLETNDSLELMPLAREEAANRVRKGKLTGMIALPKGFGETAGVMWKDAPVIEIGMDPSRTAEAAMAEGFIMRAMGSLIGDRMFNPESNQKMVDDLRDQFQLEKLGDDADPNHKKLVESLDSLLDSVNELDDESTEDGDPPTKETKDSNDEASDPVATASNQPGLQFANVKKIDVTRVVEKGSKQELMSRVRSTWDITFPQAMVWGILGCVASFAISIVRERVRGTYQRLEIAPFSKTSILAGKGLACFLSVISVVLFLTVIGYFLGLRPGNPLMLLVATLAVSFCFVGIMLVISVLGKTEEAVGGAGWGLNMVMAMFGGGMVPLMFLPNSIKILSNLSPVKWAVLALEGAIWRGFTLTEMLLPLSILIAIGFAGIAIGSWRLNAETG